MTSYIYEMINMASQGEAQGIMFFTVVVMSAGALYSVVYQYRIRQWPDTEGTLQKAGTRHFGSSAQHTSEQEYVSDALYSYTVEGEKYTGTRVSPWKIVASHNARGILERQLKSITQLPTGKVAVYYNPLKPEKSFLIKPGIPGLVLTVLLAVLPPLLYWHTFGG